MAKVDLDAYYAPTNATRLLRRHGEAGETPLRFFAYAPGLRYQRYFAEPEIRALEAEGRPTALRLQSIQTYHAVQLDRYVEYLETMNGEGQNYHSANVLPGGLDSPMLDLLNARHVVTLTDRSAPDALSGPDVELLENMEDAYPTIYEDDRVKVLEHENALPRAWIVHSARQSEPNKILQTLSRGEADPREMALLEKETPRLSQPENASEDRVSVVSYGADRIELDVSTGASGLLVLSEIYYPAWRAYVDGEPVSLYRTNYLFRGVPIPEGDHTVELRYESTSLRLGMAISSFTTLICVSLLVVAAVRRRRRNLRA